MYGQGRYAPQFGQSPNRPPRPPFMQQEVSRPPASAVQLHSLAPPHHRVQSAGQQQPYPVGQYFPPQITRHNNTIMQPYPTAQQGSQSAQYVSGLPPPLPPPPSHPRVPLPPPSQSPNTCMQQKALPLSASVLPPPPPPPPILPLQTSSLPRPATFLSHPPPLPPSGPPLPPPPPHSSTLQSSVPMPSSKTINSDPFVQSLHDPRSNQAVTTESVQTMVALDRNRECATIDGSNCETETEVDFPKSPPRPTNEKTLQNIEILCQYISQNGPAFEDMVRQNEAGNPKFEFLFGGESGSEAATAHEYYLWRKRKMCLGESQSIILQKDKHAECKSSVEPINSKDPCLSLSDSDMEMEDDITQPGERLAANDPVSGVNEDFILGADSMEMQEKDALQKKSQDTILKTNLGPPNKLEGDDEGRPDKTVDSITQTEDPFSLLKDYASDNTSEDDACLEVYEQVSTLQFQEAVASTSTRCNMKNISESNATEEGLVGVQCKQSDDLDIFTPVKISFNEVISGSSSLEKKVDSNAENNVRAGVSKQSVAHGLEEKDTLESSGVDLASQSSKGQREHANRVNPVKVDEFGRLIREDVSDTDSDDSRCNRRHGKRGRSRSLSRSPPLRRRRRSPWRRKERRSLSRSWSPKRRRSRSRSPLRRSIDIGGKKNTRGRHQLGECFNFLKGRCYRGASCRFIHNDPDKYSEPRHYRRKFHASETRTSARDYDNTDETKVTARKGSQEYGINEEEMQHDGVKDGELNTTEKKHTNTDYASKGETVDEKDKAEYPDSSVHFGLLNRDGSATVSDQHDDTTLEGPPSSYLPKASYSKDGSDLLTSHLQSHVKSELSLSHGKDESVGFSQAASSKQEHPALDFQPQHIKNSCPTSSVQISPVSSCQTSQDVLSLYKKPVDPMGQKDQSTSDSAINYPHQVSQLQLPMRIPLQAPPPPSMHVENILYAPQPMSNYISAPSEPSVVVSSQHTQYHTPQNISWGPLPTPFPPYIVTPPIQRGPPSFQQGDIPVRSNPSMQPSPKTKPIDLPVHPQAGNKQENYVPMQGSHQLPQHVVAMRPGNLVSQAVANSTSTRDARYVNSFAPGPFSSSFSHGNIPPQPDSSFGETHFNKGHSFSNEMLPSSVPPSSAGFQNPPYLQQPYGHYQAASDGTRAPSQYLAGHHNPYASTFDQPINPKFSSDVFRQGQNLKDSNYENFNSSASAAFEGQRVAHGAGSIIPSLHCSRAAGQTLPKSGGDQYDPLFDSIEPSAESLKKPSEHEDHAADNSDIMFRLSANKPSDMKINRKNKTLGAVATASSSSETDGFGETADAEVLPEEAGSLSNLNEGTEGSAGDVEIDQLKRDGKGKKNKDSRSIKLFKVELAGFVKDMLKPSWRQGNMSKEAFKTIVKKTVEKVSGAMKGRRVPKSKEKIGRYIDRSQRKLTTLVEGYVNKYAKA